MAKKRKGGGGKLSRSEVVTVRLDPKLRFAADLAARKQRRTLSSFIEWAVEKTVQGVDIAHEGETAFDAIHIAWISWGSFLGRYLLRCIFFPLYFLEALSKKTGNIVIPI